MPKKKLNKKPLEKETIRRNLKCFLKEAVSDPKLRRSDYRMLMAYCFPENFPKTIKKMRQNNSDQNLASQKEKKKQSKKPKTKSKKTIEYKTPLIPGKNLSLVRKRNVKKVDLKRQQTIESVEYVLRQAVLGQRSAIILRKILKNFPWALEEIRKTKPKLVEKAFLLERERKKRLKK